MTPEDKILISNIEEKAEQCSRRQTVTTSRFLDMHERSVALSVRMPYGVKRLFYGGFEDSERNIAVFLPEFSDADESSPGEIFQLSPDGNPIVILEVEKDRFSKPLGHRDYLGALMGLGINRDMTGDIIVGENGCHIAVIKSMAGYISENLTGAGRGTLSVSIKDPSEVSGVLDKTGESGSFTVSSLRLDSIVKNGFSVSRDAACEAISKGLVYVNDVECLKPDRKIKLNDKITFRHKGRIIIDSLPGKSKKGREIVNVIVFRK